MGKGREELRRGIRDLIEHASKEMDAIAEERGPTADRPAEARPILRLVRDVATAPAVSPSSPPIESGDIAVDLPAVLPRRGVCAAYYVNRHCWEVPEAYCNTALHVCMMRECPIYHLHREELERRFAGKFNHFW